MDDLKKISADVWWDGQRHTLYLRGLGQEDIPARIAGHRQTLDSRPDDVDVRAALAALLLASGRQEETRVECEHILSSDNTEWKTFAGELIERLSTGRTSQ